MNKKLFSFFVRSIFVFGLFFNFSTAQAQLASWTYDALVGTNTNPAPNTGAGSSSIIGTAQSPSNTNLGRIAGLGCGAPDTGNLPWFFNSYDPGATNESNGVQYNVSTAGYKTIIFTWQMRFSASAPNTVRLQYTTDGSTWVDANLNSLATAPCSGVVNPNGTFTYTSVNFTEVSANFSSIPAVENNANFAVRILAAYDPLYGRFSQTSTPSLVATNGGTWRIDNVSVGGTIIPGPTPVVMNGTATICAGSSTNINVTFTGGNAPFTLVYTDNVSGTPVSISNYVSGTNIPVTPVSTRTYSVTSVTASNGQMGTSISGSAVITVNTLPNITTVTNINNLVSFVDCAASTARPANFPATVTTGGFSYSYYNATTNLPFTFPYSGGTINYYYRKTSTSSPFCYTNSATFTFTRKTAPSITTQPSTTSQVSCQGIPFTAISIVATGTATLTYQWWQNTTNSTTGGTQLTQASYPAEYANGSTAASFTPLSTYPAGTQYWYYVIVTNACSSVKSTTPISFTITPITVAGTVSGTQTICAGATPADLSLSGHTGSVTKWQRANDSGFTSGVADILSTATTLTGAIIGALTQDTYFRAYVQNGGCTVVTTAPILVTVKFVTYASGVWSNGTGPDSVTTAIFSEDYSSPGDLNACYVKVNAGNVTINSNHTLTVQNGVTVSGGNLIFENNASLFQVNNTTNTGAIIYKRQTSTPVSTFDYTYWSSPVSPQTLAGFSPTTLSDKYFWMNPVSYAWEAVAVPGLSTMRAGQGYIIRGPQGNTTASIWSGSFIGVPNNGDITPLISGSNSVVYTDASHAMNCLGNPYPSALSADLLMLGNPITLGTGTTLYFWTHNTPITNNAYTFNDYAIYNYTGGAGTVKAPAIGANSNVPNGKIAAGQAFMIKAIATGAVTFKNSMRLSGTSDNSQFYRTSNPAAFNNLERNRIWLELENNEGSYKQILIGYIENATNGFENGYDGEIIETGNPVNFYSVADTKKLGIQGRALPFNAADEVALGLHISTAGMYTIGISALDGLFAEESVGVYIEDKLLNTIYDLRQGAYSFASAIGTFDTRFVLRYDAALKVTSSQFNGNKVIVYKNENQIIINSGNIKLADVKIFDISGRLLYEKSGLNATEVSLFSGFSNSVLMIVATSVDNETVTKKIIN